MTAPEAPDAAPVLDPLFVAPDPADSVPRRAAPPKAAAKSPKPMPADPEAPYGWTVDKATGERRPKKTAGRQPAAGAGRAAAAPRKRAANRPRTLAPAPESPQVGGDSPVQPAQHSAMVEDIIDGTWMIAASAPVLDKSVLGIHLGKLAIRAKAQAAILRDTRQSTAKGIGDVADHVPVVGAAVRWLGGSEGGWILPAMLALIPLVVASADVWKGSIESVSGLAHRTDQEWKAFVSEQQRAAQAEAAARTIDGQAVESGAQYPGEVPLPGMGG